MKLPLFIFGSGLAVSLMVFVLCIEEFPKMHDASYEPSISHSTSGGSDCPDTAPQYVLASDGTNPTQVIVKWGSMGDGMQYHIYRADTADGSYVLIDSVDTHEYQDSAVSDGVTYYYKVSAVKAGCSESPLSESNAGYTGNEVVPRWDDGVSNWDEATWAE